MDALTGKKLLILGLARQGKALARFACGVGAQVVISDLRSAEQLADECAELQDLPIEYVLGSHPLALLDGTDVVALSGSVPADAPLVQAARERGIAITNDSQEFIRRSPTPTIGITGSAGKTTTTSLTGKMCAASGITTWVGGNIGQPLITHVGQIKAGDWVVQELSSFQLEIWTQSPPIAAVLNITPNHLDRHQTMAGYTEAKSSIVRYQTAADSAILCADDAGSMALQPLINGRLRTFSMVRPINDGAFLRDEQIWLRDQTGQETAVCPLEAIQLRGRHNIMNVLAACTIADTAAVPIEAMRTAIAEFKGVEHRLEVVRTINGVQYINDSIATAPERALAALAAFDEPLVLLAGGRDKKMNWDVWAETVMNRTKAVVLFGDLAELLEEKLADVEHGQAAVRRVTTLAQAVKTAAQIATQGDIVLLSPGGTSYDAFKDFVERGELFRELVRNL